jgi:chorismate dehydratase
MQPSWRLGVVSYLNSRPLIEGLDASHGIQLVYDVPARLPGLLEAGEVEAALIPVIDLARRGRRWKIVSDACIGCDGETLSVRIFSRVPPEEIERLHIDGDSHTSVALATLVWREMYGRNLILTPLEAIESLDECEAILLIGDKVVSNRLIDFNHEIDLGGAWKSLTGLPFVFAVWAARREAETGELAKMLSTARDEGVRRAKVIAADAGPGMGWPVELAQRYLTMRLNFKLTDRHLQGMQLFFEMAQREGIVPDFELAEHA